MMRTRTIATGAGITGSADCPQAFRRRVVSSAGPLALCGLLPRRRSTIRLNHSHMQIAHTLTRSLIPGPSMHRPRPPPPRSGGTGASRACPYAPTGVRLFVPTSVVPASRSGASASSRRYCSSWCHHR